MVTCKVCLGNDFELQDGHYYCQNCHTQAEDWQEEEHELAFSQSLKHVSIIAQSFQEKENDAETSKEKISSDAWSSWEGLSHVLVGQIDELEALAPLPKDFKFTAFNIWAKCLQTIGVCFTKRQFPFAAAKTERDLKWIMMHKLHNKRKYKRRRQRRKATDASSDASSLKSAASLKRKLASQVYLSETSVTSTNASTSMIESTLDDEEQEDKESTIFKRNRHKDLSSKNLTRKTLLGILFLSLQLTESDVKLTDLLRWLNHNHVSYRWIEQFLPGESCLNAGDRGLFGPKQSISDNPNSAKCMILSEARQIHATLNYPHVPLGELEPVVRRFLQELCLPSELNKVISKLLAYKKQNSRFTSDITKLCYIPLAEVRAVAFIIFALKLLLCLDDNTEYQLSNWAEARPTEEQHFVWTNWVEFIELRNTILADHFFWAKQMFNKQAVQTSNNTVHLDPSFLPAYSNKSAPNSSSMSTEKKKFLLKLSSKLSTCAGGQEENGENSSQPDPTKSLTPLTVGLKVAIEHGSFKPMAEKVQRSVQSFSFSKCDYLTKFLEKSNFAATNFDQELLQEQVKNISFSKKQYLVKLFKTNKKAQSSRGQKKLENDHSNSREYWLFPLPVGIGEEVGERLLEMNLPVSFWWLLRQCSLLVDSSPLTVFKELLIIENAFFENHCKNTGFNKLLKVVFNQHKNLY
ncbi:TATA box-binding protein-associated factor RNA polymerase I subunit B [Neocloeon triangulifer]|uniref:TATA box-binding protein-associated factor RNA polymerase I subunit B n=1 Tax=Neocloeon triangulifer TaxID=2078957 RepID=UPI00286F7651|nr:TATA box-binding protein-associated factor RNA polymerase I subunit B [Neocloeon triangulifer]